MNTNQMRKTPAAFHDSHYVHAARQGEAAAWNTLYRKHYPGAFAAALRICKDNEAAADAVQDAFVTAFLKLSQLKDPDLFGGWLRQIVTHACFRALAHHRKLVKTSSALLQTDAFWHDQISKSYDQVATRSRLYSALASLPEGLHSTLLLRYFSTFHAYEDIAAILGIPVGTV
ncbi:MAG: sigma-70 family RNA polymerase sigma factor, partial [Cytophagales bacterium]|nr:sigma-70 family RNA polymerase sigma factor [Cytophagales bacterium]